MNTTNYDLGAVEVAQIDDGDEESHLLYQIWVEDRSVESGREGVADQDEVYHAEILGEIENIEEYAENLEPKVSVKHVNGDYYECSSDTGPETDAEAVIWGYDTSDPWAGDRPDTAAELSDYSDEELEEILTGASTGVPVSQI